MSKYSDGSSIDIQSLSPQELKIAIKEWAEGDASLENLLWICHENQIETNGCNIHKSSYISLFTNNSKDKIVKMLNIAQSFTETEVHISPDGGNPFSGPNWDRPYISISINTDNMVKTDKIFDALSETLTSDKAQILPNDEIFAQALDFLEFFER